MAAGGLRPVVAVYSTFSQRAADQIIHDIAVQNLPVTVALDRSGFVPDDGETHQGLYDIALYRSIPNLTILSPASGDELAIMLRWASASGRPCLLRYPKSICPPELKAFAEPVENGKGRFVRDGGAPVLLAFTGGLYPQASEAADILAGDGIDADLYNLRFLKPVDDDYLASVLSRYQMVAFMEEGQRMGGFGEYAAALALRRRIKTRILAFGAPDLFLGQAARNELIEEAQLDARSVASGCAEAFRAEGRLTILRSAAT
ncbi:MAG: 1-deoxy-D-xylulose-5-phosphate synthase [Syntrophaceae bacterium PtaU1.Bin231]|nr:MAG: 1-deoxy-D-xylulose-5-phosphate synthase [Syntrophaceae bacterium PtaU1.Bin231]